MDNKYIAVVTFLFDHGVEKSYIYGDADNEQEALSLARSAVWATRNYLDDLTRNDDYLGSNDATLEFSNPTGDIVAVNLNKVVSVTASVSVAKN